MAVYTDVSDRDLEDFLAEYDLGAVVSCKGIAEGIENSNFLLQTETGSFILTLYEKRVKRADLPFFLGLMEHLAAKGIACPLPIHGRDGAALRTLCGRPAVIVTFLKGMWPKRPTPAQCGALGAALAGMHLAGADFAMTRPNDFSVGSWRGLLASAGKAGVETLRAGLYGELEAEVATLETSWPGGLPSGLIHADLFPDNVFFLGDKLSGFIDFYFACTDMLVYDIAVCLNAWCFDADASFNVTGAGRLLRAYHDARKLSDAEFAALPVLARGAALRFTLTRLYDWLNRPEGALVRPKDPLEFLSRLRFHRHVKGPRDYGFDA